MKTIVSTFVTHLFDAAHEVVNLAISKEFKDEYPDTVRWFHASCIFVGDSSVTSDKVTTHRANIKSRLDTALGQGGMGTAKSPFY